MSGRDSQLTVPRADEAVSRDSESQDRPRISRAVSSNMLAGAREKSPSPEPTFQRIASLTEDLRIKADFLRCSQRALGGFFSGKRKEYTAFHVIDNQVLTYYGSDSKLDPLGSFPLLDASLAVEHRDEKYFLCLRPVGCGLVHVMETPHQEKAEWIEAFRQHGAAIRAPLLEDWMWKTGSKMTRWHRRKFVFFEDGIDYFKQDTDEKEMGTIPILPGLEVKIVDTVGNCGEGETPFSLCITYKTAAEDRDYHINAISENQRERWINRINAVVAQPVMRKLRTSVIEGYLYKNAGRDGWQRLFAVLNDMDLAFYKCKYDGVPASTIPLSVTTEANPQDRGALSTFVLWEKGDEGSRTHLLRCADDQTTAAWTRAINQHFSAKLTKKNPDSLREGYLVLCPPPESTGIFEGQRRHFFVLVKNSLMYYKRRDDSKPTGEIPMSGNAFVYLEHSTEKPVFSCAPSGDEGCKKTYLQSKDALQRVEWVNVLVENIKAMRTKKVEDSVIEGYMFLATGLKITKRFFVLTNNSLDWYRKRADPTRQGGVDLLPESEALFEDEEKGDFLFSVAASGDEGSKKTSISCYSESDQSRWVQAINDIIEAKNVKLNPQSVKEGYLWKDNSSHNYNKRYFVLLSDKMLYYAKRKDAVEAGKEKGSIALPGGTEVEVHPETNNVKRGKVFPFNVIPCGDEGARVYALEACSSKGRDLWIEAVRSVLPKSSTVNSFSVLEGYLNKSDGKGKNWHKRYCVLWQDKLLYYKQKPTVGGDVEDQKEAGRIDITYDSSISEGGSDSKMNFMFQVCPSGDEGSRRYFMQADDEAMMNKWMEVISTLIEKRPQEKRDPDSLMEDFISISNNSSSYRKRYCCLYSDRVVVYQNKADKKEYTSIELTANSFIAMQDSKLGIFHLGQDYLFKVSDTKKAEKWIISMLRLCSKMKKVPLFGGTLNDGCYLSTRRVPLLCYEIVMHLLPKVMEMTNLQAGNKEVVASIQQQYEEGKKVDLTQYAWNDVLDVLVLYLKETGAKSPLIGPRVVTELEKFLKPKAFQLEDLGMIRAALMKLDENRLLLSRWILYFLSQIAQSKSRMTAELCAMRFAPVMVDCAPVFEPPLTPSSGAFALSATSPTRKTSALPFRSEIKSPSHHSTNSMSITNPPPTPSNELSTNKPRGHSFTAAISITLDSTESPSLQTKTLAAPSSLELGEEPIIGSGRGSRAGSVASGLSEHATKMEVGQRIITNLIDFYDDLFPGGIPKTYRARGQQLHHWMEIRDESGRIAYLNTQTKLRQTEIPGPFKNNATDWTFADILSHKAGLDRMHAFALNAHNAENLEFYLAVKEFRETDIKEGKNDGLVESAFALYRKFVGADAVSQVNIGDKLRLPLDALFTGNEDAFQKLTLEQRREIFTPAQAEVYRLVETNDFRNFIKSQEFKEHLVALAESLT